MVKSVTRTASESPSTIARGASTAVRPSTPSRRIARRGTSTTASFRKAAASADKEIKTITEANKGHSAGAAKLAGQLADIRRITERNADGVRQTRGGTADLLKQAELLTGLVDSVTVSKGTNGRGRAR